MALVVGQAGNGSGTARQPLGYLERLQSLAAELGSRGLVTRLNAPAGRIPSLRVVNPTVSRLAEDVYAGRSQDGLWWFWWPWAERIAPCDELTAAAGLIARVLRANQSSR